MKARFGFAMAAVAALAMAGCASGSGGGASSAEAGNPPRDNSHTQSAQLLLTQAQMADEAAASARYREALEAANNSILEEPTNPMGYFQAGQAQAGLGDLVAADSLFDQAMELYPAYEEEVSMQREAAWISNFNAAIEPLNAGDNAEGLRLLEGAETIFPMQRPEALINLGVTYSNMDRIDDAIGAYQRALEVIRGPRTEEADSATQASWRASEGDVTKNLARLLGLAERHDEAASAYEDYLASYPNDVQALSSMAAALQQGGMADSAQAIYDNLMSQPNLTPRDYFNIGVGLYTAEVYDRAAEAFERVASASPQSRDANFNLAQALYEAESWEALVPVGQHLANLDGYNPNSHTILAKALIETGAEQEGVAALEAREALAFTIEGSRLNPRGGGGATLTAQVTNKTLDAGTNITIRAHFLAEDGSDLGTVDTRVVAPGADMAEVVRWDFASSADVMGYYFEVVSP